MQGGPRAAAMVLLIPARRVGINEGSMAGAIAVSHLL